MRGTVNFCQTPVPHKTGLVLACPRPASRGGPLTIAFCRHGHRGKLGVRAARDGDRALVEIGDNGPGIPEPVAGHVLEPFYPTKPVGNGTGLGLDTSWRIRRPAPPRRPALHLHPGHTRFLGAAALTQNG